MDMPNTLSFSAAKAALLEISSVSIALAAVRQARQSRLFRRSSPAQLGRAVWDSRNNFGEKPDACDYSFGNHWNYRRQSPI
ncbi:hypothetical protein [Sphingopyxis sp.]|uniref:hypothetical protein n=1 Tax=Sphingopyxis sp. TaxID=1908224 RepID=UPI0035AED569